jgi:hypothetical protein
MVAPTRHQWVASAQLIASLVLLAGIWIFLPARWAPVDVIGSALGALGLVSAFGLFTRRRWARAFALAVSWGALAIGAITVSALCFALAHIAGLYGPIGKGGAMLLGLVAALVLPYFIGLPVLQVGWLAQRE